MIRLMFSFCSYRRIYRNMIWKASLFRSVINANCRKSPRQRVSSRGGSIELKRRYLSSRGVKRYGGERNQRGSNKARSNPRRNLAHQSHDDNDSLRVIYSNCFRFARNKCARNAKCTKTLVASVILLSAIDATNARRLFIFDTHDY